MRDPEKRLTLSYDDPVTVLSAAIGSEMVASGKVSNVQE